MRDFRQNQADRTPEPFPQQEIERRIALYGARLNAGLDLWTGAPINQLTGESLAIESD